MLNFYVLILYITLCVFFVFFFFFQAEDGIRDHCVTGVQTCALPISLPAQPDPGLRPSLRTADQRWLPAHHWPEPVSRWGRQSFGRESGPHTAPEKAAPGRSPGKIQTPPSRRDRARARRIDKSGPAGRQCLRTAHSDR